MTVSIDRNTKVVSATLEAVDLANKLRELAGKDRWTRDDLIDARNVADHLYSELASLGLCTTVQSKDKTATWAFGTTVYIKVAGVIKHTMNGATIFSMPGFKGGYYQDKLGPARREDNVRSIPDKAITVPYSPAMGMVGIDRNWLEKPAQRDLRDYLNEVR